MKQENKKRTMIALFLGVVVYAFVMMAISRELIIPRMLPSTDGHISGDPQYYHQLATAKLKEIKADGIGSIELRLVGQGSAGIASMCYMLWESPYSVVVLNAILHGISAVFMSLILMRWFSLRTSVIATLPLIVSPYMMVWFSQLNKDSFVLAGSLLFVYGLLRVIKPEKVISSRGAEAWDAVIAIVGISLIWIVRPYVNQVLLAFVSVILIATILMQIKYGLYKSRFKIVVIGVALIVGSLAMLGRGAQSDETIDSFRNFQAQDQSIVDQSIVDQSIVDQSIVDQSIVDKCFNNVDIRNWHDESYFPQTINDKLRALMGQRCLIFAGVGAQLNATTIYSIFDMDILPAGSLEALAYLPRAALQGVFSPGPGRWLYVIEHGPSVFYMIVSVEALMLYLGLIILATWIYRRQEWGMLTPIFLSMGVMTVYGMATPFMGALYRYRYPWWMLLICMSAAAAFEMIPHRFRSIQKE